MGVMHPANRQPVSRWADFGKNNRTTIVSEYLRNAVTTVNFQTQIVMAVDLRDIVRPHKLDETLKEAPETKGDAVKREMIRKIAMSLQGATLTVQFTDKVQGTLQVDFSEDPEPLGTDAKTLVLEMLNKPGAALDDLNSWQASIRSNAILLEGELSKTGQRKIFGLLELPTGKFSTLKGAEEAPDNFEVVAKASKNYYLSISTLLDDLRKEFETNRDARRNNAPVYLERYGRMIDRLPILNVDQELLGFGASVSETLRSMSTTQRTGGVRAGVRKSNTYGAYNYSYDGYGYGNVRSTSSVRSEINAQEQGKARVMRFHSWKQIEDDLSNIRKQMTDKYQIEF